MSKTLFLDTDGQAEKPHVSKNTGQQEWYTPAKHLEAAREVMGEIDLDPASSEIAQVLVKAKRYYTIDDDGLTQAWSGRVWLNPPFSAGVIEKFVDKLCASWLREAVTSAILLTNNASDTAWFQQAFTWATAMCFPAGRIRFLTPSGSPGAPLQGQVFFYFGEGASHFCDVFSRFGRTLPAHSNDQLLWSGDEEGGR